MASHPNRSRGKFELAFAGSALTKFPRYRRFHQDFESAKTEALDVLTRLRNRAAHPAIIYGPACGRDGTTVA